MSENSRFVSEIKSRSIKWIVRYCDSFEENVENVKIIHAVILYSINAKVFTWDSLFNDIKI